MRSRPSRSVADARGVAIEADGPRAGIPVRRARQRRRGDIPGFVRHGAHTDLDGIVPLDRELPHDSGTQRLRRVRHAREVAREPGPGDPGRAEPWPPAGALTGRARRPTDPGASLRAGPRWNAFRPARLASGLRGYVAGGHFGPRTEEVLLHLLREPLPRAGIGERQPILVDEHRLVLEPRLPRLLRHVLVDALAQRAGIRRQIEPFGLAAEFYALHRARHHRSPRETCGRPATSAGNCRAPVSAAAGPPLPP